MPDATVVADLAKYRLEKARQCLNDAKSGIERGSYAVSANRSYYCILHAIRAVLAFDHFDSKKHSGLMPPTSPSQRPRLWRTEVMKLMINL
jgi:uncharacterized protein (UPF0332 family)